MQTNNSLIQVRVAIHDDAVLAAHLADDLLEISLTRRGAARRLPNLQPDFPRPGKRDEIDLRMRHQVRADSSAWAGQQIHHARRQTGFNEQLHQARANDRRLIGRLQDDRVSRHNSGSGHSREDREGKIPRGNNHTCAAWPPVLKI